MLEANTCALFGYVRECSPKLSPVDRFFADVSASYTRVVALISLRPMRLLAPTFRHGVHPPEHKDDTKASPIQQFPFAPWLAVPFLQHIGTPARAVVREGQDVVRGQVLAEADGMMSVPVHAPVSGTMKHLTLIPLADGTKVAGAILHSDAASTQEVSDGEPCLLDSATPQEILCAIQRAGVVGLGGAAFPSHVKLSIPAGKTVDTLLLNGAECEPYLTTDHRVMLEQTADIVMGIRYLLKVTGAPRAIIGIEANKHDAADALRAALDANPAAGPVTIVVLPVKYPQGAEKMLIKSVLGREVPAGAHSVDVGVVGVNVATAAEIGRLLPHGRGVQERVITIGGPAIVNKGNYRISIGTPLRFVLEYVGVTDDLDEVFFGGPMMGQAVADLDVPITKGTSGVIAFAKQPPSTVYPCIHCGRCVDGCPMLLNPSRLGLLAAVQAYAKMRDEFYLADCFECGVCSYVCPSHIPLVQMFRVAKRALKKRQAA